MMNSTSSKGALVFPSLLAAVREGFEMETRFTDAEGTGYVVRKRISGLWARALVRVREG